MLGAKLPSEIHDIPYSSLVSSWDDAARRRIFMAFRVDGRSSSFARGTRRGAP